eukprot:sb/3477869/
MSLLDTSQVQSPPADNNGPRDNLLSPAHLCLHRCNSGTPVDTTGTQQDPGWVPRTPLGSASHCVYHHPFQRFQLDNSTPRDRGCPFGSSGPRDNSILPRIARWGL